VTIKDGSFNTVDVHSDTTIGREFERGKRKILMSYRIKF
jgi:hypothetical protein